MKNKSSKTEVSLRDILDVKRIAMLSKSAQYTIQGKAGCGGTFLKNPCFD